MRLRSLALFRVLAVVLLGLTACSSDPVGRRLPVKGKVTLAGQPVKAGTVVYWPDEAKGNKSTFEASSPIGADGAYELFTKGQAGAPAGAYKVTVSAQVPSNPKDPYSIPKLLVPKQVTTRDTTPLLREVVDNPAPGAYDLELK